MSSKHVGSSSEQPIIIPDDPQSSSIGREVEEIVQKIQHTGDACLNPIELLGDDTDSTEDGWAQVEADYDQEIQNIESIDLTLEDDDDSGEEKVVVGGERKKTDARCPHYDKGARNPCLCGTYQEVNEHVYEQGKVKIFGVHGLTEEVRVGRFLVDFLEISSIWVHRANGAVLVRGLAYTRTRNLDGRVQAYQNEVCQMLQIDTNDQRPEDEQAAVEVTLELVRPEPRILHKTNKPFPECRFEPSDYKDKGDRENRAPLVCRWRHAMYYPDKRYRRAQRPVDGEILRHFVEEDIRKKRHRASDSERLNTWRGFQKIRGGSYVPNKDDIARATEGIVQGDNYVHVSGQKYTVADMFSGAGGVTKGAKKAGFQVLVAVDHWPRCNATYKANHPDVALREVDIMEFCNDLTDEDDDEDQNIAKTPLDLIHLSPPCQTWSPAHTVMGRNDPANIAALSACQHIVHKHRPRVLTFEQTFGIIQERHLPYFNALVQSLTRYGYSLQWRVFPLVQFGLPQNRKRLLMIGSAPGEPLPTWPEPTHVEHAVPFSGQRSYVSAVKACQMLHEGVNLHNVEGAKELKPHREPWDGNKPMNRTITTSGGQSYHWDGERELTLAEFARLQGFPYDYKFIGPCIKKQIGNAFPPCVVTVFMGHLRRHLEKLDGITEDVDPICIDDDDDDEEDGAGHVQPFFDKGEHKFSNWEVIRKQGDSKDTLLFTEKYSNRLPNFEYLNAGLNAHDAWRAAIEESKREDRRRSTADSSVVVTDTRKLVIEVGDDDDGDTLIAGQDPDHYLQPAEFHPRQSSSFRRPPSLFRQHHIDPSALTLRTSSIAGASSSSHISLPHHHHPQHRLRGSDFEAQGYVEVFPSSSTHRASSSFAAGPSSNLSSSSSSSRAPAAAHNQLDPTNFGQIQEAFRRNRGVRSFYETSSSFSSSSTMYQGSMSENEALDAALRASMQQLQQQHHEVPVPVQVSVPMHVPEQEEEGPIPEEAAAAALSFFGPWNPPVSRVEEVEVEEGEAVVGKGKGKAVSREQNKDKTSVPRRSNEDDDVDMDEDAALKMAIAMSMEGVPQEEGEGEEEEGGEEDGKGKGKGKDKADTKRSYNGDEDGSPYKKGRNL